MPYIGHSPTQAGSFIEIDDYGSSFNGSTTAFTLQVGGVDVTPNAQNLLVMIDGVVQMPTSAYSVSGSTITYTEAPPSGADSYVVLMGQSASVGQGTVGADELKVSGNGSNGQVLVSDGDGTFSWSTDSEPYLPLAGGTMSGAINLGSQNITNGGTITGTFVGNITGNVTGNTSGTAATVTGASQSNITSVGTLTGLTTSGNVGVGASASFKFDVQDNSGTWASRILNTNAGGQALLVRTDATNDATALGVYANGAYRFIVRESDSTAYNTFAIEHGTTPQLYLKDTGGTSNRRVFAISGGGDGIYFEGKNNANSGDGDAGLMTSYSLADGTTTHHKLTHLKGSAWNSILKLGDTSRSEQLTHINNGTVNFSIYTSNGTKGVITANHDGSAMTLGADYSSGTLTVTPDVGIGATPRQYYKLDLYKNGNACILGMRSESHANVIYTQTGNTVTGQVEFSTSQGWITTRTNSALKFGVNNNVRVMIGTDGGQILASDGSVSSPSYAFISDSDTGMYWSGTNALSFVTGGTRAMEILSSQDATLYGNLTVSNTGSSSYIDINGNQGSGDDGRIYIKGHTASNSRAYAYFNNGVSSGGLNWYLGCLRGSNAFTITCGNDDYPGYGGGSFNDTVLSIDGNRKIGLGMNPTSAKLSIFLDSGVFAQHIQQNQGDGNCLDLHASSSDEHSNDPIFRCRTDASNRFQVFNNGGVEVNNSLVHSGSSDERVKKNISTMTNVISDIEKLRGVTFKWRAEVKDLKWSHHNHTKTEYGMIAQEMEAVFPELVTEDGKGIKNIRYEPVISILLQGIKELNERIKVLENA